MLSAAIRYGDFMDDLMHSEQSSDAEEEGRVGREVEEVERPLHDHYHDQQLHASLPLQQRPRSSSSHLLVMHLTLDIDRVPAAI